MLDFATLTGAARVALGPDLPPFYTDDDALAATIAGHAARVRDPVWRMPLWRPYDAMIEGTVGDVSNSGTGAGMAGSITAALFLRRFVEKAKSWAHFDVYAWNPKPRAHGPAGGEIQAARALFELSERALPEALRRAAEAARSREQKTCEIAGGSLRFGENSSEPGLRP